MVPPSNPLDDGNRLQSAVDALGRLTNLLTDSTARVIKATEGMAATAEKFASAIEGTGRQAERTAAAMRGAAKAAKGVTGSLANSVSTVEFLRKNLKSAGLFGKELAEQLDKGQVGATKAASEIDRMAKAMHKLGREDAIYKLKKMASDLRGPLGQTREGIERIASGLNNVSRSLITVGRHTTRFRQTKADIQEAMRDAGMYVKPSRLARYANIAMLGASLTSLTEKRKAKHNADVRGAAERAYERLRQERGGLGAKVRSKAAGFSVLGTLALTAEDRREAVVDRILAEAHGKKSGLRASLDRWAVKRGLRNPQGWVGRHVESGGGSLTASLGAAAHHGFLHTVGTTLKKVGGPLAWGAAIAEVLNLAVSHLALMNKAVLDQIGGSGIFSPAGGTPFKAVLNNLRGNLGGTSMLTNSRFRDFLAMAQTMSQTGYSLRPSLVTGGGRKGAWSPGVLGQLERYGKLYGPFMGLNEPQTVESAIRLVTEFDQTLRGAGDMFIQLRKDADLAGLSATKYLQIAEQLTGTFSDLNRQFGVVVDTMRMLGSTGLATADDLKTYFSFVTNNGQPRDLATQTFLLSQANPKQQMFQAKITAAIARQYAQQVIPALAGFGIHADMNQMMGANYGDYVQKLMAELARSKGGNKNFVVKSLEAFWHARMQETASKASPLGQASMLELIGLGPLQQAYETSLAVQTAMKAAHINLNDILNPNQLHDKNKFATLKGVLEAVHMNPQQFSSVLTRIMTVLGTDVAKVLATNHGKAANLFAEQLFSENKKEFGQLGITSVAGLRKYAAGPHNPDLVVALSKMLSVLNSMAILPALMHESPHVLARKIQTVQGIEAQAQTRTTADIFANAFEYLFLEIAKPLQSLVNILIKHFGPPGGIAGTLGLAGAVSRMPKNVREEAIKELQGKIALKEREGHYHRAQELKADLLSIQRNPLSQTAFDYYASAGDTVAARKARRAAFRKYMGWDPNLGTKKTWVYTPGTVAELLGAGYGQLGDTLKTFKGTPLTAPLVAEMAHLMGTKISPSGQFKLLFGQILNYGQILAKLEKYGAISGKIEGGSPLTINNYNAVYAAEQFSNLGNMNKVTHTNETAHTKKRVR